MSEETLKNIDLENMPKHIAIIMDGNGRWAKNKGFPRTIGHKRGMSAVKNIVTASSELGIGILTLYAFSAENWKRSENEVSFLMRLLKQYLKKEKKDLMKNNIKLNVFGRINELPGFVRKELKDVCNATSHNSGMLLNLALNYGGRIEIVDAIKKIVKEVLSVKKDLNVKYLINTIDESLISKHLYTAGLPDPDLLIRTSGELRISNFLLWQIAYTELWITDVLWPDFNKNHLFSAIVDYQKRERRFGGVKNI